jgi:hypothetical protein
MSAPELPEGFHGAGPVLAAVPLGGPWHNLALTGATDPPESAPAPVESAFPGGERAGRVADASADGALSRDEALAGWHDGTPARAGAGPQAAERCARMLAGPEWPADAGMAQEGGS